ncbi:MAG: CARDB domain-containing protein, partial [Thermoplasmata archaeon]
MVLVGSAFSACISALTGFSHTGDNLELPVKIPEKSLTVSHSVEMESEEIFEGYYAEPVICTQQEISIESAYPEVSGVGGTADIIVKTISVSPSNPTAYQSITITATLTNYGEVAASGFSVEFKSRYGNANISLGTVWVDVLEPETSTTVYKTTNKLGPGYHTVMVVADSTNSVPESNEQNNIKSMVQWFK